MRALVQRVSRASVSVEGETIAEIDAGLLVLLGVTHADSEVEAERLAAKIAKLRIFSDPHGKMNLSLLQSGGEVLVVSQFTLYGDTSGGNRPGFGAAARPEQAVALYLHVLSCLEESGLRVARGRFGAEMDVALVNRGPVTLWLDTEAF